MRYVVDLAIFYTKVVNNKAEPNWFRDVAPEAQCVSGWYIAKGCKMLFGLFVCDDASLWEAIHSFGYFKIYKTVWLHEVLKVVLRNDFAWDEVNLNSYVFFAVHWGIEVKIFEV